MQLTSNVVRTLVRSLVLVAVVALLGGWLAAQQPATELAPEAAPGAASPSDKLAEIENEESRNELAQPPGDAEAPSAETEPELEESERKVTRQDVIASLTIFVLAVFVGFEVITKVPPTLHTPLMSGSNAISGITLVGAVIVASASAGAFFSHSLGFVAVTLATINVVGGFLVTHRMLAMFKKR